MGFDVAVARAYARERGLALEFVRFRWPELLSRLREGRFDVAMSGITVRPERSAAGRFTVPVAESGAVLLVGPEQGWRRVDEADQPGVRIGVNSGGHLERVARAEFSRATLIAIRDNRAVLQALRGGMLDAAVSDTLEAEVWLRDAPELEALGPFSRDRKAYLVGAERADLAADLDAWLLAREADGGLAELRRAHLGAAASGPTATPLRALLAAVDERLSLMPLVAAAKREEGLPLEVPEREATVLEAAVAAAREAAARSGAPLPPEPRVRALFRAQLEAAKQVQWSAVQSGEPPAPEWLPDLETALRPALLRIGERIAALLVVLPGGLEPAAVHAAARDELRAPHLSERSRGAIAAAIAQLAKARAGAGRSEAPTPLPVTNE